MREKDIHKLIEEPTPEKERILQRIRSQIPQTEETKATAKPAVKGWKIAAVTMVLLCVITLSIVLPLTLGPKDNGDRYCTDAEYNDEPLQQTLKEYSATNKLMLLCIDWYDNADEILTSRGFIKDNHEDTVYLQESIINSETGEMVTLSITDNKTRVDKFNAFDTCINDFTVKNHAVKWGNLNSDNTLATFEHNDYTYYLSIDMQNGQERLKEIIADMLK